MRVPEEQVVEPGAETYKRTRLNLEAISRLAEIADYSFAFAIRAVAAIGVADHLIDGPRHINDLAALTSCNPRGLLRVMRALATKGIFAETSAETFALSPLADLLRTDHPLSMRWFFRLEPDVQALAGLEYSVRTGQPAFDREYGMGYFDWMASHEYERNRFRESQRALNRLEILAISRSRPWREIDSVVDVGGNDGSLVSELLKRSPSMVGTIFDLPETAASAEETFRNAGVTDRATIVRGNVFEGDVPRGSRIYFMKRVLVGFSDAQAVTALSNVREAMAPHSLLLIMEPMGGATDQVGVSLDILMLVLGLGRMRTPEEFKQLLDKAGLKATGHRSLGLVTEVEAVPA